MMPARVVWSSQFQSAAAGVKNIFDTGIPARNLIGIIVEFIGGTTALTWGSGQCEEFTFKSGSEIYQQISYLEQNALQAAFTNKGEESVGGKRVVFFPFYMLHGSTWQERFACQAPSDQPVVELTMGASVSGTGSPKVRIHAVSCHASVKRQMVMKIKPLTTQIAAAPGSGTALYSRDLIWQGEARALIVPDGGVTKQTLKINNDLLLDYGDSVNTPAGALFQELNRLFGTENPTFTLGTDKTVINLTGMGIGVPGFVRNAQLDNFFATTIDSTYSVAAYMNRYHIVEYFQAPG